MTNVFVYFKEPDMILFIVGQHGQPGSIARPVSYNETAGGGEHNHLICSWKPMTK